MIGMYKHFDGHKNRRPIDMQSIQSNKLSNII
jgi:hypothetical protein